APADLEPSRHDALLRKAAIDTCLHRRPYGVEARVQILAASLRFLVDTLHVGDRQPAPGCHGKHLSGILERIGYLLAFRRHRAACPHALQLFRSEEHTSELQSRENLVCRLLLEKKKSKTNQTLKQF